MAMVRIRLNYKNNNNYCFFCPITKLTLTLGNREGFVDTITPGILLGLRDGTLLDMEDKIDINSGKFKEEVNVIKEVIDDNIVEEVTEKIVDDIKVEESKEVTVKTKSKRRR